MLRMMQELLPFRGLICGGLYFADGRCLSLLSWEQAPVEPSSFSQVWVVEPDGRTTCYIDPAAESVFRFYHAFDKVIGAEVQVNHSLPELLTARVRAVDMAIDVEVRLAYPRAVRAANAVLKTALRGILRSRGVTDTGRRYVHQPTRLAAVEGARATIEGQALGPLTPPPASMRVGGSVVPRRPVVSFCTHYLEACGAAAGTR